MDTKSPPEALAAAQAAARQADNETIEAMITAMADHPGVPQVMRDSMPALMRSMRQRDQADNETIEAMITAMADHPGVPQVMRDSMPALMRSMRQRDQAMADLVAAVESLRHLVAGTQPTPG